MRFNSNNMVFINGACLSDCCRRKEIQPVLEKWHIQDLLTSLQVNNRTKNKFK
jgi:hypothetical protein